METNKCVDCKCIGSKVIAGMKCSTTYGKFMPEGIKFVLKRNAEGEVVTDPEKRVMTFYYASWLLLLPPIPPQPPISPPT